MMNSGRMGKLMNAVFDCLELNVGCFNSCGVEIEGFLPQRLQRFSRRLQSLIHLLWMRKQRKKNWDIGIMMNSGRMGKLMNAGFDCLELDIGVLISTV